MMPRRALAAACLLGLVCAAQAFDPRVCFPGSGEINFAVKKNGRLNNPWARIYNADAVKAVTHDMVRRGLLEPVCLRRFNWVAVEGCFDPAYGTKLIKKGEYSFRWNPIWTRRCKKGRKNVPQIASWVDTNRKGLVKQITYSIDVSGNTKIYTVGGK